MAVTTQGIYGTILTQNSKPITTAGIYGTVLTQNYQISVGVYGQIYTYEPTEYVLSKMGNMHLIEIEAYDPVAEEVVTLRYCSGNGYTTKPTDTPPNMPYLPRVKHPGLTRVDIYSKGKTGGASTMRHGEVVLVNIDGGLDDLVDYGFDGRTLTHRTGPARRGSYPTDFPIQETYLMEQLRIGWSDISVVVRDKQFVFDRPLQTTLYAGNNSLPDGLEGVATDLKGKPKPLVYGAVYNVPIPFVNTSKLIYQLNDGAIADATIYDRGLALTPGADYTTADSSAGGNDLLADAPSAGTYRLYKAGGYVRLGSSPSGLITADIVQGAAASNRTIGQIVNQVALKAGLAAEEISAADVAALDVLDDSPCGIAILDDRDGRGVLDELCTTLGAYWTFDRTGVLRVDQLIAPAGTPEEILTTVDIKNDISRDPTGDTDRGVPVYKVTLKYKRNYVVQGTDIAGAVTDVRKGDLAQEWRTVTATDATVQTKHLLAEEIEIFTNYTVEADAQAEADRQLALRKVRRDRITCTVLSDKFSSLDLGDVVQLTVPRFGYTSGKLFTVIGRQPDYRLGRGELTLWG